MFSNTLSTAKKLDPKAMKPDHLTAEVTADSLNDAVEKTLLQPGCTPAEADLEVFRVRFAGFHGRFGTCQARRMARSASQSVRSATTPPLNLKERRILHDLFKQPDLESRSIDHAGDDKVVVLLKRS